MKMLSFFIDCDYEEMPMPELLSLSKSDSLFFSGCRRNRDLKNHRLSRQTQGVFGYYFV